MKAVAILGLALVACGSSEKSGAFDEDLDGGQVVDSAVVVEDGAVIADSAVVVEDGPSADVTADGGKPDVVTVMDAGPPVCPSGKTAPPLKCPEVCTGGCVGDACRILCSGPTSCGSRRIDCPPGMKCLVECSGVSSCGGLDLRCPETGACSLQCSGTSSCGSVQLRCPASASCAINCGGISSCGGGQVQCGGGACTAECPSGKLSKVDCGASCLCTNKC